MINELQFLESHLNSPISLNAHFILSSLSSETTCPQDFINLYHPTGFYLYPLRSSFKSFFCKTSKMMERLQRDLCNFFWEIARWLENPSRHTTSWRSCNVVVFMSQRRSTISRRCNNVAKKTSIKRRLHNVVNFC